MAGNTRPYFVTYKGVKRLVEAASPAVAAQHVVGPDIAELRPARASEVSAWYRDGHPVDVAGGALTAGVAIEAISGIRWAGPGASALVARMIDAALSDWPPAEEWNADGARRWLVEQLGGVMPGPAQAKFADEAAAERALPALVAFDRARDAGVLTLAEFDAINAVVPALGDICSSMELRDGETIAFDDVVTAIGEAPVGPEQGN